MVAGKLTGSMGLHIGHGLISSRKHMGKGGKEKGPSP